MNRFVSVLFPTFSVIKVSGVTTELGLHILVLVAQLGFHLSDKLGLRGSNIANLILLGHFIFY